MYTKLLTPVLSAFILTTSLQAQSGQPPEESPFGSTLCDDSSLHFSSDSSPIKTLLYAKNSFDKDSPLLPGVGFRIFSGYIGFDINLSAVLNNPQGAFFQDNMSATISIKRYFFGSALLMFKANRDQLAGFYAGIGAGVGHMKYDIKAYYNDVYGQEVYLGNEVMNTPSADAVAGYGWSCFADQGLGFLQLAVKSPYINGALRDTSYVLETGIGF